MEIFFIVLGKAARFLWILIIVSNPVFLAIWLMNRDKRRREEEKAEPEGEQAPAE